MGWSIDFVGELATYFAHVRTLAMSSLLPFLCSLVITFPINCHWDIHALFIWYFQISSPYHRHVTIRALFQYPIRCLIVRSCKVSEAVGFVIRIVRPLLNLTGTSATVQSNFKAIWYLNLPILQLRDQWQDLTMRHLVGWYGDGALDSCSGGMYKHLFWCWNLKPEYHGIMSPIPLLLMPLASQDNQQSWYWLLPNL